MAKEVNGILTRQVNAMFMSSDPLDPPYELRTVESRIQLPLTSLAFAAYHPSIQDSRVIRTVQEERSKSQSKSAGGHASSVNRLLSSPFEGRHWCCTD